MPNEFTASGTASQNERFVIAEADSLEKLHPDGAWLSSDIKINLKAVR